MSAPLPPLRPELDIMPSPVAGQPGLLIRDPYRYSDAVIIVPPLLARLLALFDGEHSSLDLQAALTRATGDLEMGQTARDFVHTMRECGFLEDEDFQQLRERKHREFSEASERPAAHAGSAYDDEPAALHEQLNAYGAEPEAESSDSLVALAAPHVSPEGGYQSYAAAYRKLNPSYADKTFVILGTSHYGEPEKFGLTRKAFTTPLGRLETDTAFVDGLARRAPDSVVMEDYCHSTEHSIEFQCIFLQHMLGTPNVKIVPILCGPFAQSLLAGQAPETTDRVGRFFDVLGELGELHRERLIWVLGIDLAHIGQRYGDELPATAGQGYLQEVQERDQARLDRVCAGDAEGFYHLVHPNRDDLRWCGYSPVYTFLRVVPEVTGRVLRYEQWNIDPQSVVSFTGLDFHRAG